MKLIILASGRGSRLGALTKKVPKCMVKLDNTPIIGYLIKSFQYFQDIAVVTGYRANRIKKELGNKVKYIKNDNYRNTNMVHSLFCASKFIDQDVIVSYSDIIVHPKIFNMLKKEKGSVIPLNYKWLENWQKRMSLSEINKDAEDVRVKKNEVVSIGQPIKNNKLPRMQFMGLIKLSHKDFWKLNNFFIQMQKPQIDFTSFLNEAIKCKIIRLKYLKSKLFWTEIDTLNDLKAASKMIRSIKLIHNN